MAKYCYSAGERVRDMNKIILGIFLLSPLVVSAATTILPEKGSGSAIGRGAVVIDGGQINRACWYDNRQYSEGAPLEVGGRLLICSPKNGYDLNGPLVWMTREQLSERNKPKLQIR